MTDTQTAEAEVLQRKYRTKRLRWARAIGRPYAEDIETPDPGLHEVADDENG